MTIKGLGELGLLELIKPYLAAGVGGDDAAVFEDGDGYLVASTDMFVEGVHFDLGWMSPEDVGWRSIALALGDLAAEGATPAWALVSVAVPPTWSQETVTGIYAGMKQLGSVAIAGGDMSATGGPAVVSVAVAGHTAHRPLARADIKPGWSVAVTGSLGAAAVALRERRPVRLVPLLEEGARLNRLGLCCGDVSDGLVREMEKFAAMSGVGAVVHADRVRCAPGASLEEALTSGEEAALVCVGPHAIMAESGLLVVGETTVERQVKVIGATLQSTGYDHFA